MTAIDTGYTALYDTTDGYYMTVDGDTGVTGKSGSTTPAAGKYNNLTIDFI